MRLRIPLRTPLHRTRRLANVDRQPAISRLLSAADVVHLDILRLQLFSQGFVCFDCLVQRRALFRRRIVDPHARLLLLRECADVNDIDLIAAVTTQGLLNLFGSVHLGALTVRDPSEAQGGEASNHRKRCNAVHCHAPFLGYALVPGRQPSAV